jgi:hypothetical protein
LHGLYTIGVNLRGDQSAIICGRMSDHRVELKAGATTLVFVDNRHRANDRMYRYMVEHGLKLAIALKLDKGFSKAEVLQQVQQALTSFPLPLVLTSKLPLDKRKKQDIAAVQQAFEHQQVSRLHFKPCEIERHAVSFKELKGTVYYVVGRYNSYLIDGKEVFDSTIRHFQELIKDYHGKEAFEICRVRINDIRAVPNTWKPVESIIDSVLADQSLAGKKRIALNALRLTAKNGLTVENGVVTRDHELGRFLDWLHECYWEQNVDSRIAAYKINLPDDHPFTRLIKEALAYRTMALKQETVIASICGIKETEKYAQLLLQRCADLPILVAWRELKKRAPMVPLALSAFRKAPASHVGKIMAVLVAHCRTIKEKNIDLPSNEDKIEQMEDKQHG